jgi:hypothetical protein
MSNDREIEAEIVRMGLTAPRITPEHVEACIVAAGYHVFPGTQLTVCCLKLRNGFTVSGESACASPENFDPEIGRKIARENAVSKIWALEGYLLKDQLLRDAVENAHETGWLVEHGPTEAPVYLHMKSTGPGWTKDAFAAIRFACEADARQALVMYGPDRARVAEHAFGG